MKIMMTLLDDDNPAPIDEYLAARGIAVLSKEHFSPDESAILSIARHEEPVLARERSLLSAVWILDVPTRASAVDLAKDAPGGDGTIEIREAFSPADFGAEEAPPPAPPALQAGKHRYIAFVSSGAQSDAIERPPAKTLVEMDAYCAPLLEDGTMMGGEGLKSSSKGSRIRRAAAQRFVLDGPFTESKELVGGYMILQARSLDDAVDVIRPWLRIHHEGLEVDASWIEVRRLL